MKVGLLVLCVVFLIVVVSGCAYYGSSTPKDTVPSDKYVAILEEYTNRSTLIGNTTYPTVQPLPIPMPAPIFDYDNSHGMIHDELQNNGIIVNASFKVLLSRINYIDTPTERGVGGFTLTGIYSLPYTIENVFTIVNVTQNGTIMATYDDRSISLKPGESGTYVISRTNTTGYYLMNRQNASVFDPANMTQLPWPVTNELSFTITNEGIFNKTLLNGSY